jgi:hypothetical protein
MVTEVGVAATSPPRNRDSRVGRCGRLAAALCLLGLAAVAPRAAVLPEDLAEIMYHSYDGGGVEVNGPALRVRKGFAKDFSAAATYYVDSIS